MELYPKWNARVWEDGTFSLGYLPQRRKEVVTESLGLPISSEDADGLRNCVAAHGILKTLQFVRENPEAYPTAPKPVPPLESTTVSNSHSVSKRGRKGISGYGRKLVRNAALRLERETGTDVLSFLTLTLPSLREEDYVTVCANWAEIVRVMIQRLKRALKRCGLPGEMVGVTEVQEKRFAQTGNIAYHLHMVFKGRDRGCAWALKPSDFREMWKDSVSRYLLNGGAELYWDSCENVTRVKKSASGYLGKYMSKGVKACQEISQNHPNVVLPACWYVCTNSLRKRVKQCIIFLSSRFAQTFEDMCFYDSQTDSFIYLHSVFLEFIKGYPVRAGYIGKLSRKGIARVQRLRI